MRAFYSALFTDKHNPSDKISSFKAIDGWDYILFTNLDITSDSWTIRKIEPPNSDFVISAKMIKWLSHKYLSDYDMVFWMDAYCIFNPEKESILKSTISRLEDATIPLFIKKHPLRNCIYNELTACLEFKKINLEMYEKVKKFLLDNEVPRDYGLYETMSMIKLHKNKKVINIGEEIIELVKKYDNREIPFKVLLLNLELLLNKEKEQICVAYVDGLQSSYMLSEEYYNQTYNQNK